MLTKPTHTHFPKVPLKRRGMAFLIDFLVVWLVSLPFETMTQGIQAAQIVVFIIAWLAVRVVLVAKNQGQSLGRWALDMKVIDFHLSRVPGILELSKREGIAGFCALLAMIGVGTALANSISLILLVSPLAADCGVAFADIDYRQAFHDRIGGTVVIASRRGFSLDLRLGKLLAQVTNRVK
jgi:uncharacterized RDD family membrane protein YckC